GVLEFRLDRPPAQRHPRQGRERRVGRRIGEERGGLRPVQVLLMDQPEPLPRLCVPALSHPLKGKAIDPRTLRALAPGEDLPGGPTPLPGAAVPTPNSVLLR